MTGIIIVKIDEDLVIDARRALKAAKIKGAYSEKMSNGRVVEAMLKSGIEYLDSYTSEAV